MIFFIKGKELSLPFTPWASSGNGGGSKLPSVPLAEIEEMKWI